MSDVRVRYGRNSKGQPKNTLVTIRQGDLVYFGIARCRTRLDKIDKHIGVKIALGRAEAVLNGDRIADELGGVVMADAVKVLLRHFEELT